MRSSFHSRKAAIVCRTAAYSRFSSPGSKSDLTLELELLGRVGSHLDERCVELRLPQLDYRSVFEQVRDKLACEVRLDLEQRQLTEAQAFYAGEPDVQIPRSARSLHGTRDSRWNV